MLHHERRAFFKQIPFHSNHFITVAVHQGDLSQAMQYYDEALSCGLDTSQLQVRVMLSLKELLTKQGQAVPAAVSAFSVISQCRGGK